MFEQTFVDDSAKTRKPWTIFVSFLMQALAIGVLILIPLIYTEQLKPAQLTGFLVAPPPPPTGVGGGVAAGVPGGSGGGVIGGIIGAVPQAAPPPPPPPKVEKPVTP